jgi:carboxyl-terminal processing protease
LSENELNGAFKNPGRLGAAGAAGNPKQSSAAAAHSPPIKAELIGTAQDAQLKAALDHLDRSTACAGGATNGSARPDCK